MKNVDKIKNTNIQIAAPPSKAHTLRALIISALADGKSTIENPLLAEDQLNMIQCLKNLGIEIEQTQNHITVQGAAGKFSPVVEKIDVGQSGVTMNFLTSACCLADKPVTITGDQRMSERPVAELVQGLSQLGAKIEYLKKQGFLPIKIQGSGLTGGLAKMNGAKTSQYFSSLLISAPCADAPVTIECIDEMTEKPYLDITLQMMKNFGIEAQNDDYKKMMVPKSNYAAKNLKIEGDYSSASFFFLAAAVCNSKVTVTNLNPETKQGDRKFLSLLKKMGAEISESSESVTVTGQKLNAVQQNMSDIPDLVLPAAIAAAFADGKTELTNIGHLRLKECDRLAVTASQLAKMGVNAECTNDSLIIRGTKNAKGASIDPHNDHRIAMSFAVAGLVTGNQQIQNENCVAKSFPDFWERFEIFYK